MSGELQDEFIHFIHVNLPAPVAIKDLKSSSERLQILLLLYCKEQFYYFVKTINLKYFAKTQTSTKKSSFSLTNSIVKTKVIFYEKTS